MIDIQPGEKVVLEVRRHWYVLIIETLFLSLFFISPFITLCIALFGGIPISPEAFALWIFVSSGWFLLGWVLFFVIWTNYYLDVWIVTDRKIIDVEQHRLFSRDISEFGLDRIQNITIEVSGILPTMLHFGNIHVETAGESRKFIIKYVPHPDKVKDVIFKQHEEFMKSRMGRSSL